MTEVLVSNIENIDFDNEIRQLLGESAVAVASGQMELDLDTNPDQLTLDV